jgi:hypothetical protein
MVCEIESSLISNYPLDELLWKPSPQGICGMLEEFPEVQEFLDTVESYFPKAYFGFLALSKVIPGQVIKLHTDQHDGRCKTRIHIPLKTNEHSYFYTSKSFHHMQAGFAYVIDPTEEHGVVNLGHDDRIHLIFNMVQ